MKAAIGELRVVVGHRLHAQIFAWSMGTPVAGISFERKADAFLAARGIPRFDLWALESGDVLAWLDREVSRSGAEVRANGVAQVGERRPSGGCAVLAASACSSIQFTTK